MKSFLFIIIAFNGYSQSNKDSVVYDTIPARFQIYEDHCERCSFLIEEGYVVYQNTARFKKIKIQNSSLKLLPDSTILVFYLNEPIRTDINPYLRKNKLPMWGNYTIWDFKLDRECMFHQLRGL